MTLLAMLLACDAVDAVSPPNEEDRRRYAEEERERLTAAREGRVARTAQNAEELDLAKAQADMAKAKAESEADASAWRTKKRTRAELIAERRLFAKRLETEIGGAMTTYVGMDGDLRVKRVPVTVETIGKDARTYRVTSELCSEDTIHDIAISRNMYDAAQVLGVNKLYCTDGYRTWSRTWR